MPRMTYSGTSGATVQYGITAADKSVDTAPTNIGLTADIVGPDWTAYSVVVADAKRGMTIDWYEDGEYIASQEIPVDVLTPATAAAADAATIKAAATEARLAELDAANLPADSAAILAAIGAFDSAYLGTDECTLTIKDDNGDAIADARVYVSSDIEGTVRSATKVTNAVGQVTFNLTAGDTFYAWRFSSAFEFTNPQAFVAVED